MFIFWNNEGLSRVLEYESPGAPHDEQESLYGLWNGDRMESGERTEDTRVTERPEDLSYQPSERILR